MKSTRYSTCASRSDDGIISLNDVLDDEGVDDDSEGLDDEGC